MMAHYLTHRQISATHLLDARPMDLSLSPEQSDLHDAVARLYAKESHPERVRSAEVTGFDETLWQALVQMGLPTMGVAEAQGGGGASLTDLAVVAEQHGAFLGSAPLIETMVVARLLSRCAEGADVAGASTGAGSSADRASEPATTGARSSAGVVAAGVVGQLQARMAEGTPAALALRPVPAGAGVAELVPGAPQAGCVVGLHGDDLVAVRPTVPPERRDNLHAAPIADVRLDGGDGAGRIVLATGPAAVASHAAALDDWRVLQAAALAGLARAALDLGVQYVKDRHQFGVPIGSFQTIQHRLADLHTAADGARLLAYEAAWAADEHEPAAAALAAQAFWFCGDTAEQAAGASLHFHGGYGFMLEYDVQLYARRAKGWRLVLGDPHAELRTIARRRWLTSSEVETTGRAGAPGGADERLPRVGMDFRLDVETLALRDEVRAFLAEHLTPDIVERSLASGTMHDWGLHRKLCERGYLAAGWPVEVGGSGRSAVATTTLMQELYRAGAPVDGMGIAAMVGATLLLRGTDQQRDEILPRILAGEVLCCLGYSEPDAGSDVAAVQTRAVRDGDDWVIDGQKMFTTMAHEAEHVFLLTRTDPDVPKHRGLTMFLVPTSTPGIEVTPVETLGGERTNITFYTGVRVPDTWRVGDVDDGWSVMHAALVYERNSANWGEPAHLVATAAAWAVDTVGPDGARPIDDPGVQERLARWDTRLEVGRLLLYRSAWMAANGALPHVEGSMAKLAVTEAFVAASSDLVDMLGAKGIIPRSGATTVAGGLLEHAFRHAMVTTIYGGSSEVQREIIAQRGLGLPRAR
jgi:alkylation response protein AidB-like acyl-CoA dehydrogenase